MMFSVSTAFAAPLLKIVGENTFGICLFGRTRGGKTTATLSAGSVIGFGKDEQLLNWYSTTAGLETYFHAFNDHVLPIDDLSKLPAKTDNERYLEVRDLAYKAIGGDVKGRHPSFTEGSAPRERHYRFIVLTSYERSLQQLAEDTGQARIGGETVRLIDVPAYYDDLNHIFDRTPSKDYLPQVELGKLFTRIREAIANNHGCAFQRYLRHLIREQTSIARVTNRHRRSFVRMVLREADSIDVADLARTCGLIYAAGRIAISCKVLRWKRADLRDAITKAFNGARQLIVDNNLLAERGYESLRKHLKALPKANGLTRHDFEQVDGFRELTTQHARYVIRADAFGKTFKSRHEKALVMKSLLQDGRITLTTSNVVGKASPQEQFVWPDGKRRRSYELKWPRGGRENAARAKRERDE